MDELAKMLAEFAERRRQRPAEWACTIHGAYASAIGDTLCDECPACASEARVAETTWRKAWRRWHLWCATDVPARFATRSLSNWQPRTNAQAKALSAIRAWSAQWAEGDLGALVLSGAPGLGKTHLACGLIIEAIADGYSGLYVAVPDLMLRLRESYARDADARPGAVLEPLHETGLLVLDEIAASRGTDWERETLGAIVDDRYRDGGGLVIATNAAPRDLAQWIGSRAADRLAEFAATIVLDGESYRSNAPRDEALRAAVPRFTKPPAVLQLATTVRGEARTRAVNSEKSR